MAAKISVRKTRRLRALLAKHYKLTPPPPPKESFVDQIVMTVLWCESPPARAEAAFVNLAEEFVDWNELRVSVTSEVGSILESCGLPAPKGAVLKRILSKAVEELYSFDFELLCPRPREQVRDWFITIEGVPHQVAAAILYYVYGYDRVLVDAEIARVIQRLGLVPEEAPEADIEAGLADVIPARESHFIYDALRQHAATICTKKDFDCRICPLRKECETGKKRLAELAAAEREARKTAKAEARAHAEAEAAAKPKPKRKSTPKAKARAARSSTARRKPVRKPAARRAGRPYRSRPPRERS